MLDNKKFILFEYQEDETYGIAINKNDVEVGNTNEIEDYAVIQYDENVTLLDDENQYHAIALKTDLDEEVAEDLTRLMQTTLNVLVDLGEKPTLSKIVGKLSNVFKKISREANRKTYVGLMAELAFIKKCEVIGYDISPFYQVGSRDTIDFYFPNNVGVEIKSLNKESKSIIISDKQLDRVNQTNDRLLAIDIDINSINGLNLEQLFKSIQSENFKARFSIQEKIVSLKTSSNYLFDEIKINLDGSNFIWVDKKYLPIVTIRSYFDEDGNKDNTSLISAKFKIFVSENIREKDFETMIENLLIYEE